MDEVNMVSLHSCIYYGRKIDAMKYKYAATSYTIDEVSMLRVCRWSKHDLLSRWWNEYVIISFDTMAVRFSQNIQNLSQEQRHSSIW